MSLGTDLQALRTSLSEVELSDELSPGMLASRHLRDTTLAVVNAFLLVIECPDDEVVLEKAVAGYVVLLNDFMAFGPNDFLAPPGGRVDDVNLEPRLPPLVAKLVTLVDDTTLQASREIATAGQKTPLRKQ